MIGGEYKTLRHIILSKLDGNSSWKNGKPEAVEETVPIPETAVDSQTHYTKHTPVPMPRLVR
jgi:hypothetical protein